MYKLLLIDRNSIFGTTFAGLLERSGYQVDVTDGLDDGLELYRLEAHDLILLGIDVDDPTPFASAIRALDDAKLIALLSHEGRQSEELKEVLLALKGHPIFYKPFRTEVVLAAIYAELVPQKP